MTVVSVFHQRYKTTPQKAEKLEELNDWYTSAFPQLFEDNQVTVEDLKKITEWKMLYRPGLLKQLDRNSEEDVREVMMKLKKLLKEDEEDWEFVENVLNEVSRLKGVGPATASAIVSAVSGNFAFMSDEIAEQLLQKKNIKYTMDEYRQIWSKLKENKGERTIKECAEDLWREELRKKYEIGK
ncbi:hypothetical protein ROZALSC1DRAFT_29185 [Rozella allomycis CSF55]|uniref:Uncharacterized protein n=1 Tax=Rozella allomycis (strain CSF55) TaxID=988480 RepID=A0A075AMG1_ROZAC|nr:hypothetical protein O9G_004946 [Rozella allomycis CSF55]RKP19191.1 hypothetical protein ROZALSC1DRAFT_29185 [Rozella allomycis CSF55]|eukprot:EPZ30809.1 hypothetical protein O9G_004946 [Rozella allomycis CSF55]